MRQDAHNRLQPLVPDHVLMRIRTGSTPLQAWMEYRGLHAFELASRIIDCECNTSSLQKSVDALAQRLLALMGSASLPPGMLSRIARALDIPDAFLIPSFYSEVFGYDVAKG